MIIFLHRAPPAHQGDPWLAGTILRGKGRNNLGLRLRLLQDQAPGDEGALEGRFVILETGNHIHTEALQLLVGRETDAQEILAVIRRHRPACVSVVNKKLLAVELAPEPA